MLVRARHAHIHRCTTCYHFAASAAVHVSVILPPWSSVQDAHHTSILWYTTDPGTGLVSQAWPGRTVSCAYMKLCAAAGAVWKGELKNCENQSGITTHDTPTGKNAHGTAGMTGTEPLLVVCQCNGIWVPQRCLTPKSRPSLMADLQSGRAELCCNPDPAASQAHPSDGRH